jgi:hypothetical protein
MPIVKEWNCRAHGEFENASGKCPSGCPKSFVVQEIRTAPAYRRPGKMKWVDQQMRGIAADAGLTDMRSDGKAHISVRAADQRRKELAAQAKMKRDGPAGRNTMPHWVDVKHAQAGFSQRKEAAPTVSGADFGVRHQNAVPWGKIPAPRPMIVKRDI